MGDRDAREAGFSMGGAPSIRGRLVELFEHIQEGVALHELVCDGNGQPVDYRILDINPQYEKHMGLVRRDVAGKLASAAYGTGTPPYLKEFASVAMGGPPLRMEVYSQSLQRHFSISVAPVGANAFATILSDITLFKTQGEAIEKSRLAQRALLDNQPHLAWLKDRESRFLAVNKAFAQSCGQASPEAVVGKTDLDVWPLALAEAYRADDRAVMESGTQKAIEEQIADVDGTRWFETYKSPVFEPDGSIVGTTGIARDITERKRAEEARLRSERKLGQILDLAPEPIAVSNLANEFTFVNQAFCELVGYQRSEIVGRNAADLGVWENPDAQAAAREQLHREGYLDALETTLVGRDGARHQIELTATLVEFDEATAIISAGRDVTESRQAEERAKRAAETLSQYFSLSLDLLCIANAEGRITRLNPAWQRMLGYPLNQLENAHFRDYVHPDDLASTSAEMQRLSKGNQVIDFHNRLRHADGSWRWIEWRAVPGEQGLIYAVARDITQRRLDELALQAAERTAARSRERLVSVSELAHIGHFTIDFATGRISTTPELYRIFGQAPEVFAPTRDTVEKLVHPEDREAVRAAFRAVRNTGEAQRLHFRGLRPTGELRYCLIIIEIERGLPLPAEILHGLVQDLTELRRAEEEQRKLEQQVMQAQKLESLGMLAGGIAHDFNNLLTSVLGNAELALSELSITSPARPYLEDIEKVSRRAADLCRQMLAYSGKGRFVVQPVSLNEVIREMAHLLSVSISKKVVIQYHLLPNLPSVMADATQLRQVVMNLITNASEAIAEASGVVTLSTGVMDCDAEYLKGVVGDNDVHPAGRYAYLEVSDTGCGMEPETMGRIFEPFFTTKFTGRGLGLAAVLGIVRGHKGALRVCSELGRGTTFKILLPAHDQPAPVVDGARDHPTVWRGKGLVLLADDEDAIRSMGRRLLERAGFDVVLAVDGRDAIEVFAQHKAKVRLVILDMTMPRLDGEVCFRELRCLDPAVQVIMTSGYNEQEVLNRFVGKGLAGFIQKPYSAADLFPMIRRALGEKP